MNATTFSPTRAFTSPDLRVSALGLGCWPIGGPMYLFGAPDSYGQVDDQESIRAIHCALDLGLNLFDTADCYGGGHSERVLGEALRGRRDRCVLATKFGYSFDETTRNIDGETVTPSYIRRACEASLRRLRTDYIDLYQIHNWHLPTEAVSDVADTLEALCGEGLIRSYGWSTDLLEDAAQLVGRPHFRTLQYEMNVLHPNPTATAFCRTHRLVGLARSPLAMGLLSGRFGTHTTFGPDHVRGSGMAWVKYFRHGKPAPHFLRQLEAVRELLTRDGRTLVQGALGYLWATSEVTLPIPGFRTVEQVRENAAALHQGPLDDETVRAIETVLAGLTDQVAGNARDMEGAS